MQKLHLFTKKLILDTVDLFYPVFKRFLPLQTYRYAACGGFNTLLDICLFFISYNYILEKTQVNIGFMLVGPHIAAFLLSFIVTFPIGFYLSRYVVFQETSVAKKEQLGRYFMVVMGCLVLNYLFLKIFVDVLGWYPTLSKIFTTFFVVAFSYFSQKNFTFRSSEK